MTDACHDFSLALKTNLLEVTFKGMSGVCESVFGHFLACNKTASLKGNGRPIT
jgi:hypothetical protein